VAVPAHGRVGRIPTKTSAGRREACARPCGGGTGCSRPTTPTGRRPSRRSCGPKGSVCLTGAARGPPPRPLPTRPSPHAHRHPLRGIGITMRRISRAIPIEQQLQAVCPPSFLTIEASLTCSLARTPRGCPAPAAAPSPSAPPLPPPSPEPRRQERRPWTCVRPTGAGRFVKRKAPHPKAVPRSRLGACRSPFPAPRSTLIERA